MQPRIKTTKYFPNSDSHPLLHLNLHCTSTSTPLSQIEELEEKLANKKMYMEELQENEKLLYESFTEQLGENNKFADFLTKVSYWDCRRKLRSLYMINSISSSISKYREVML